MHFLSKNIVKVLVKMLQFYTYTLISSRKFSRGDTLKSTFEIFDISQVMVPEKLPYNSKYWIVGTCS